MRHGAVSEAQQQHKPHWPTRRATGARAAVRTAWRLPVLRCVCDGGPEGAIGRERAEEVVEFGRGRDVLHEQRLSRRRRAPRRRDGRRRRFGARYGRRCAERGVKAAVQRAPQPRRSTTMARRVAQVGGTAGGGAAARRLSSARHL